MSEAKARILGLVMVAAGVAAGWFFGWRPLAAAQAGAPHVSVSAKVFIFAPMAIAFGLVLLIGGAAVADAVMTPPRTRRQHLIVWPLFLVALAAGGLGYWWYQGELHRLGYLSTG